MNTQELLAESRAEPQLDHCADAALKLASMWHDAHRRWLRAPDARVELEYATRCDQIARCASACGVQRQFGALIRGGA